MEKICHVVGAGDFSPELLQVREEDLIIAADAGLAHLKKMGLAPDLYVGDGDSLGYIPEGVERVLLPTVKDDTDTLAALREGLARGYRLFYLYGALGGTRFSHSVANLQTLAFLARQGARGVILDAHGRTSLLEKGLHKPLTRKGYFSLFALEKEAEVSVSEAKYSGEHLLLFPYLPLGVSNEGDESTLVSVHRGSVLLVSEESSL
ncbi:MAG: thiamine diphosphokinase [Clostridia bacterium]|nr:thiamine diphosphokinase [Clostridia bacterium]